jgi:hypothetical protein
MPGQTEGVFRVLVSITNETNKIKLKGDSTPFFLLLLFFPAIGRRTLHATQPSAWNELGNVGDGVGKRKAFRRRQSIRCCCQSVTDYNNELPAFPGTTRIVRTIVLVRVYINDIID